MNKTAVITGASRRLGLYLTKSLLGDGFKVIVLTRNPSEDLLSMTKTHNLEVIGVDYEDMNTLDSALTTIKSSNKSIDLLIHNASRFEEDHLHENDIWEYYDSLIAVHMKLPVLLNNGLKELMSSGTSPGCIIHITDISVDNPSASKSLYCSTKAASENLSKSYAKKFAPSVRVNSIQPGPILFSDAHTQSHKDKVTSQTLLTANPGFEPILQGVKFIFENQFLTGTTVKIDGGRSLKKP